MKRLRLAQHQLRTGERALDDDDYRYVVLVHRLREGAGLRLFDPTTRTEADATLEHVDLERRHATVRVHALEDGLVVAERAVRVVQALPKGDKLDAIVRDATELGASELWLATSLRTVVVPHEERFAKKLTRLERIAEEASRQAGRSDVPRIVAPRALAECLAADTADVKLFLTPHAQAPASAVFGSMPAHVQVSLYVGPEGGFDEHEVTLARAAGAQAVSLGRFVLRTETAVAAVLGALRVLES